MKGGGSEGWGAAPNPVTRMRAAHDGAERPQTPNTQVSDCKGYAFAGVQWRALLDSNQRPTA